MAFNPAGPCFSIIIMITDAKVKQKPHNGIAVRLK